MKLTIFKRLGRDTQNVRAGKNQEQVPRDGVILAILIHSNTSSKYICRLVATLGADARVSIQSVGAVKIMMAMAGKRASSSMQGGSSQPVKRARIHACEFEGCSKRFDSKWALARYSSAISLPADDYSDQIAQTHTGAHRRKTISMHVSELWEIFC